MEDSSWQSQLVVLTIVGGIWAFSIWRFIRVFSEWLIPEPCEPFLPIPQLNQRSTLCLDTKRSPKFLRPLNRWQHASLRLRRSDLSEETANGQGQGPPVTSVVSCRASKSPSLPVIPRPSTRRHQDTASRSDSFPNFSLKSSQPRIILTNADSEAMSLTKSKSSRTAGSRSSKISHSVFSQLSSTEQLSRINE